LAGPSGDLAVFNSAPVGGPQLVALPGQPTELAVIDLPAYGHGLLSQYRLSGLDSISEVTPQSMVTPWLRLSLNQYGEIDSLRAFNAEFAQPNHTLNHLVLYEDRPLAWEAWDIDHFYEDKAYPLAADAEIVSWRVTEAGPLRAEIEIVRRFGKGQYQCSLSQKIRAYAHSPRIDFVTEIDWQARKMLLRALFPLNLNTARALCDIQFGYVERPTHRNTSWDQARFEVCAQQWVALHEGGLGAALLNNGKYGHSLHNQTLGLTLLKGATHPDPDADRGLHRFTYSLLPAATGNEADLVSLARQEALHLNQPARVLAKRVAGEALAQPLVTPRDSFCNIETIKMADDGDGLIIRLAERQNRRGEAWFSLAAGRPARTVEVVNLLESPLPEQVVLQGQPNQIGVHLRPFEIKTLRVRF
jgi:alpha-mannosidase